jgi:hypothetical protein
MLADEQTSPEQFAILRRMTPGRRLEIAERLYWSARRMKTAWLKSQHPAWSAEQVAQAVKRNFSHARS